MPATATPPVVVRPAVTAAEEAYANRPSPFKDCTRKEYDRYRDLVAKLPTCPGFKALQAILRDANRLRAAIREAVEQYGPDSGSVLATYDAEFDDFGWPDIWADLTTAATVLGYSMSCVESNIPAMRPAK